MVYFLIEQLEYKDYYFYYLLITFIFIVLSSILHFNFPIPEYTATNIISIIDALFLFYMMTTFNVIAAFSIKSIYLALSINLTIIISVIFLILLF